MNDIPLSSPQPSSEPVRLSQEENDALLATVMEQVESDSFDASDRQALQQLVESLGDSRGLVRMGFAETLGKIGKPATPLLTDAISSHPDPVVRRAAAKTMTLIGDQRALPTLLRALLRDEDTVVRCSAVGAMAVMGEDAVPALFGVLYTDEYPESAKGLAAWAIAFIGPQAKQLVFREYDEATNSPAVRTAVIGVVSKVLQDEDDERAYQLLLEALDDPDASVRCEAAAAAGAIAYAPAIPKCVGLLAREDSETRKAGALALMKIGDRAAIEDLAAALERESDGGVKSVLALAISQLEKRSD